MTNRIALVFGLMILAAIVVDYVVFGPAHGVFLGKKLAELIEWIAFWR